MPKLKSMPEEIPDFQHFEQHVAKVFIKAGCTVETAKNNQPGYDLIVKKGDRLVAVQVKWLKNNVSTPQLLKFAAFLETDEGKKFDRGIFVTTKGYSGPARGLIKSWGKNTKVFCGVATENDIEWISFNKPDKSNLQTASIGTPTNSHDKVYFGVFTCKGGVGKTTVAAHLAGAFVLQEFNVALIDLDPEQNLHKLVGDGIYLPKSGGIGNTIEVFTREDWDERAAQDCPIVICDCSPAFERNPKDLLKKLDYCLIPTTFNPLGLNKHGNVIKETVHAIRQLNPKASLFVLVNNYKKITSKKRKSILKQAYFEVYREISTRDDKFYCIDPEEACIRASDQLYYWGTHLLENPDNPRSELAFELVGGRCYPRDDFLNLADYLEIKAGLGNLRNLN